MGGVETAANLKELDPALTLIVSSGYSDAPVISDFRKYGFDDVIPKPWAIAQVGEVFRRVLVPGSGEDLGAGFSGATGWGLNWGTTPRPRGAGTPPAALALPASAGELRSPRS